MRNYAARARSGWDIWWAMPTGGDVRRSSAIQIRSTSLSYQNSLLGQLNGPTTGRISKVTTVEAILCASRMAKPGPFLARWLLWLTEKQMAYRRATLTKCSSTRGGKTRGRTVACYLSNQIRCLTHRAEALESIS